MSLGGVREAGWDPWEDTSSPDIEAAVRAAVLAASPEPPTVPELGPLDDVEGDRRG